MPPFLSSHIREMPGDYVWQTALDIANEGIWGIDLKGNCIFANRSTTEMLGFESEEMLGNNMHSLAHHHHPDGREFAHEECPIYQMLLTRQPFRRLADTLFRKDGSPFAAETSAYPIIVEGSIAGAIVVFRDLSETALHQQRLKESQELAELQAAEIDAILECIPQGVYIRMLDGRLLLNRHAREMNGDAFPAQLDTLHNASLGRSSTSTARIGSRWIESTGIPVERHGKVLGAIAVNTDVTFAKLQADALRKSEKLASMGQLASSIAHEINNPLESITNLLYLIRHAAGMEEVQSYAQLAQTELARVTEITLQTLRFHRQQTKPTPVDLVELLRDILALYRGRLLVRSIHIETRLRHTPPVLCLEGELRQVINNLIRNALDAMHGHGGHLRIRLRPQRNWRTMQPGARITVADTGHGISPGMMENLFEPFQTTKELTGTGLGLWVSKGIVMKHGGFIRARSRTNISSGTVFTVWLPVEGAIASRLPDSIPDQEG